MIYITTATAYVLCFFLSVFHLDLFIRSRAVLCQVCFVSSLTRYAESKHMFLCRLPFSTKTAVLLMGKVLEGKSLIVYMTLTRLSWKAKTLHMTVKRACSLLGLFQEIS